MGVPRSLNQHKSDSNWNRLLLFSKPPRVHNSEAAGSVCCGGLTGTIAEQRPDPSEQR